MKKLTAIVLVSMLVIAFAVPAVMALSPERTIVVVPTKDEIPDATADSPYFIFVADDEVTYAKFEDPETGELKYVPEDEIPENVDYEVVKGAEETWASDSDKDFVVSSDADETKGKGEFVALIIDGKIIDASNYVIKGNSEITLTNAFMATLAPGEHSFTIQYEDGSATSKFYVSTPTDTTAPGGRTDDKKPTEPAPTGYNIAIYAAIALISLGAIGIVALTLVKTRKTTEK